MRFVLFIKTSKYSYVTVLMVINMKFGNILRELIEHNQLTQKQMGQDLNIAPSTIGNYVRNIREPDHSTLIEIAKYFNVSTDYLLEKEENTFLLNVYLEEMEPLTNPIPGIYIAIQDFPKSLID